MSRKKKPPLLRSAGKMPGAGAAGRKMVAELWVPD